MARILLFGYFGYGNFGDELLIASIKENLPDHNLTVISGNPKETEDLHQIKAISRRQFWHDLGSFDLLLVGGGGVLQNITSNRSLFYYLAAIKRAQSLGVDVYLMAQGLGPFKKNLCYPLINRGIRSLKGLELTVRDEESLKIANQFGLEADLVADLALSYTNYPKRQKSDSSKKVIGVSVKEGFVLETCKWLQSFGNQVQIRLFAFHKEDHGVCLEVEHLLQNAHTIKMEKFSDLQYFSDIDFLWGMRLHALVVAAAMGIPAIGISYDPKVESSCSEVGFSWHNLQTIPKEEWIRSGDASKLIKRSEKAWDLFRAYREHKYQANKAPGHSD
ncbi:MAG: polysaccharide pyruvyl transferase CsaB [Bacillota bacterium]